MKIGACGFMGLSAVRVNYHFNEHLPELEMEIRTQIAFPDTTDAPIHCADMPPGVQRFT
jgi:hypothetical protein